MNTPSPATDQEERLLASLAHGSILLGLFTNGVGGIGAALVIYLTRPDRASYAARQALQALVYQTATFLLVLFAFACWGVSWLGLMLPPLLANPAAYQDAPPPTIWAGMTLLACPFGLMLLFALYALYGALRCFGGADFRYAGIGRWLEQWRQPGPPEAA